MIEINRGEAGPGRARRGKAGQGVAWFFVRERR